MTSRASSWSNGRFLATTSLLAVAAYLAQSAAFAPNLSTAARVLGGVLVLPLVSLLVFLVVSRLRGGETSASE
jgi:hypothetical protein